MWKTESLINTCFVALLALLISVAYSGCKGWEDTAKERKKSLVSRYWDNVFNKGNLNEIDEIVAKNYVFHNEENRDIRGRGELKKYVRSLRRAFPDIRYTVEDALCEGNIVVCRVTGSGTHLGEWNGKHPTGKQVVFTAITMSRIADNEIAEEWSYSDRLAVLQQIGALPLMGRAVFSWSDAMKAAREEDPNAEENKTLYYRETEELWNKKNLSVIDKLFDVNFVNHDPAWPEISNRLSFKQWVAGWAASAPDMQIEIEDIVAEGDKVAARWISRWTDRTGVRGKRPTGKRVMVEGIDICRFVNGKIIERWWCKDILGGMRQLGVVALDIPSDNESPDANTSRK